MERRYPDVKTHYWDTRSERWIREKQQPEITKPLTTYALPKSQPQTVFDEYRDIPATFFKAHRDMLKGKIEKEEKVQADLRKYLKREITWAEYEDSVLQWFLRSLEMM